MMFGFKEDDVWVETVTKRRIPESEVPPAIREKLKRSSENVVITEELEVAISNNSGDVVHERKVSEAYVRE